MKKILSMILALAMILSLGVTAFAADGSWNGSTHTGNSANVTADFEDAGEAIVYDVYSVNIAWNVTSDLTYIEGKTIYTWHAGADELYYSSETAADVWTGTATVRVTVTNYSNKEVYATVSQSSNLTLNNTWTAGTDAYDHTAKSIGSAAEGVDMTDSTAKGSAVEVVFETTINYDNITAGEFEEGANVATITVTLSK